MNYSGFAAILVALIPLISLSACNGTGGGLQNTLVKDIQVAAHQENDETFLDLKTLLNMNSMQIASMQVTLIDPSHPGEIYGSLALRQVFSSSVISNSELDLSVNFTKLTHWNLLAGPLPNGTSIPVNTGSVPILGGTVGGDGIKIYGAMGTGVAMLGVAIPIREFDNMGTYVGGLNIFPYFTFANGVTGVAGIFAGAQPRQSGVAVFVDASSALAQLPHSSGMASGKASGMASVMAKAQVSSEQVTFSSPKVSKSKLKKVYKKLHKLDQQKALLHPVY